MWPRLLGRLVAGAMIAVAPGTVGAQPPEYPGEGGLSRYFAVGGEVMAAVSPPDNTAFFNYSDYQRNLLRIARLRFFGEWRPAGRFSVISELRTENVDDITAPALYARWQPSAAHEFFIHAGRIPPVNGGFSRHAYGRDNIVIGQPLAYQYLTSLRDDAIPATIDDLLRMRGRGWQSSFPIGSPTPAPGVPLFSVSKWDTGISGMWQHGPMHVAGAVTRGSPAVPVVRETNDGLMWSGRAAARLPGGVTVGLSGARGQWLTNDVLDLTLDGQSSPSSQSIIGTDVEVGVGAWLVRSEWLRSTFELPIAGEPNPTTRLTAWSGFLETRYRPFPRWQVGVRIDRLAFGSVQGTVQSTPTSWDAGVDRVEAAVGFRATRRIELRGGWQHNWRDGGRVHERGLPVFAFLYWF